MAIKRIDFHRIFCDEGQPFYNDIYQLNKNEFNDWIAENFNEIGTVNSFKEVAPDKEIVKKIQDRGYVHRESQCHYSAKAISLICEPEKAEYITGFISRNDAFCEIVTHSFNNLDGRIIDFARLNTDFQPIEESNSLPHTYFGIKIQVEFVKNFEKETFAEFSMRPLLYEWYCEINNKQ